MCSGKCGAVTYQGSGIGAIEAEESDGRLDGLVGSGVGADLRSKGSRGSCSPGKPEECLSRQHRCCGTGWSMEVVRRAIDQSFGRLLSVGKTATTKPGIGSKKLSKRSHRSLKRRLEMHARPKIPPPTLFPLSNRMYAEPIPRRKPTRPERKGSNVKNHHKAATICCTMTDDR